MENKLKHVQHKLWQCFLKKRYLDIYFCVYCVPLEYYLFLPRLKLHFKTHICKLNCDKSIVILSCLKTYFMCNPYRTPAFPKIWILFIHFGMVTSLQIVFIRKNAVWKVNLGACNIHFTFCFKCKSRSFYHPYF